MRRLLWGLTFVLGTPLSLCAQRIVPSEWALGGSLMILNRDDPTRRVWGTGLRGILTTPHRTGPVAWSGEFGFMQARTKRASGPTAGKAVRENSFEGTLLGTVALSDHLAVQAGPALSYFVQCASGGTGGESYGDVPCNDAKEDGDIALGWTVGVTAAHRGGNAIWRYGVRLGGGSAAFGRGKVTPAIWSGFTLPL